MKRQKKKDENKVAYGTISLPLPLIKKIKKKIRGTGVNSVSSYISFILRQILSSPHDSREAFSTQDKEEIKARLKALGYA